MRWHLMKFQVKNWQVDEMAFDEIAS